MKFLATVFLAGAGLLLPGLSAADAWDKGDGHRYLRTWNDNDRHWSYRDQNCRVIRHHKKNGKHKVIRECKPSKHAARRDRGRDDWGHRYRDDRPLIVIEPIIRIGGW